MSKCIYLFSFTLSLCHKCLHRCVFVFVPYIWFLATEFYFHCATPIWKHSLLFYFWLETMIFIFGAGRLKSPCIDGVNDAHPKKYLASWKQCALLSPKHPLLLIFGQKHGFSSLGVVGSNLPPDFKVWMAKIWKIKVWAEISAQCQVQNTPYFWFSAKKKDFQFLR